MQTDAMALSADAIALSVDTMALSADAITLSVDTMALSVDAMALSVDAILSFARYYFLLRRRFIYSNPESNVQKQNPQLLKKVGNLRLTILTNQTGLL
ncbi:hypothetical protein [Nostoc sp.]|uniref:hypothetical protein n=1 Tax=Nostoc sp. TaxID=1180 RepID=UPI002FFBF9F0